LPVSQNGKDAIAIKDGVPDGGLADCGKDIKQKSGRGKTTDARKGTIYGKNLSIGERYDGRICNLAENASIHTVRALQGFIRSKKDGRQYVTHEGKRSI